MRNDEISAIRNEEIRVSEEIFGGKCWCCTRKITTISPKRKKIKQSFKGFTFHHLKYYTGEPRRKFYAKGATGTWPYKRDVLKIIRLHPEEFLLLCNPHHKILEDIYKIFKHHPEWVEALIQAVKMTDTNIIRNRYTEKVL